MNVSARAVEAAKGWIGTPYQHQGRRKGLGCDCIGLVLGVWEALGGDAIETAADYSADWVDSGSGDQLLDACRERLIEKAVTWAEAGDLLLFAFRPHLPVRHVGILIEGGRFVHAYERVGVIASPLVPSWRRRIRAAFAFPACGD